MMRPPPRSTLFPDTTLFRSVWGGVNGSSVLNTGGRYNPGTDSWTATSTTSAPAGRYVHTAVWTGSEMIVWGGNNSSSVFNTGGRYNPRTDSWTSTSTTSAPTCPVHHTAVSARRRKHGRRRLDSQYVMH